MQKIDFKKTHKELYGPAADKFTLVDVPAMQFLKVDGMGDPNVVPSYQNAVEWLFGTCYAMKFASKAAGQDYVVPPLEGLWWSDDPAMFATRQKEYWQWSMMILVPDFVTLPMYEAAIAKTAKKLGDPPPSLRLEPAVEGLSLQTLHRGSYDDEGPALARLHYEVMPEMGFTFNGPHHEIYLSDPRKVAPSNLKTILRQPVISVG